MAVISMGRRNTKLEPSWHGKQKLNSLARVRPAGTLPWLGFHRVQPKKWFFRASNVESAHWMVLHRPVELAAFIRSRAELPKNSIYRVTLARIPLAPSELIAILRNCGYVDYSDYFQGTSARAALRAARRL